MGHGKITRQKKIDIKALLEIGLSQRQVAQVFNVSQKCFLVSQKN